MKLILIIGGVLALVSVVLGAFAAHGLKNKLTEPLLNAFSTGVEYQFLHSLALVLVVILAKLFPHPLWHWCAGLFILGVLCFSGSLYALALTGIKWFGPVTPIGGVMFITGWAVFVIAALKGYQ